MLLISLLIQQKTSIFSVLFVVHSETNFVSALTKLRDIRSAYWGLRHINHSFWFLIISCFCDMYPQIREVDCPINFVNETRMPSAQMATRTTLEVDSLTTAATQIE